MQSAPVMVGRTCLWPGLGKASTGPLVVWVVGRNTAKGQTALLLGLLAEACQTTAHCWAARPQEVNYLWGRELAPSYPRSSRYLSKAFWRSESLFSFASSGELGEVFLNSSKSRSKT